MKINMEDEIRKIEEAAKKKELYITSRVDGEFSPQINEIESKLGPIRDEFEAIEKSLEDMDTKMKQLKKRKTELLLAAQPFMKELKKVNKEKAKHLEKELKAITKEKNVKKKAIKD
jgi:archaellum component FlaC